MAAIVEMLVFYYNKYFEECIYHFHWGKAIFMKMFRFTRRNLVLDIVYVKK